MPWRPHWSREITPRLFASTIVSKNMCQIPFSWSMKGSATKVASQSLTFRRVRTGLRTLFNSLNLSGEGPASIPMDQICSLVDNYFSVTRSNAQAPLLPDCPTKFKR